MLPEGWAGPLPGPVVNLIRGGYMAVGTFFVLSGFVLAHAYFSTVWTRPSLLRYAVNRFARVYPVYLLSLMVVLPMILRTGPVREVLAHLLLLQGWRPFLVDWNTPAWSLSCEAFFYLCFPLAAVFIKRLGWPALLLTAAATCLLPSWLKSAGMPQTLKPLIYVADFLMGIAAARAYALLSISNSANRFWNRGRWLYWPGLAGSLALVAYAPVINRFMNVNAVLRPMNALIVLGLALGGGTLAAHLARNQMVRLGQASYALYILHVPLLWWFRFLLLPFHWIILSMLYLSLAVWVSVKVFAKVEEPANRYLRKRLL